MKSTSSRPQGVHQSPPPKGRGSGGGPYPASHDEDGRLPPAIFIMGPTASGKTDLALELCAQLPLDIVSVDSAQVFRDMNVGTAKPDAATLAKFPHGLIDLISPEERYSAAQFCTDARQEMARITATGRVPLLVGGTMLYFKALIEGLADLPQADPALRSAIDLEAAALGWPALHTELARLDPDTAARLAPNDAQRIQRALEVLRLTGKTLSECFTAQRETALPALPYRVLSLALLPGDRAVLHSRIAARFSAMIKAGLVEEVELLRSRYLLNADLPAMRCVGYRQAWEMLEGRLASAALEDRGIFATRQFAKRQITWLKKMAASETLDPLQPETTARALALVSRMVLR